MASYIFGKEWVKLYLTTKYSRESTILDVGCCDGVWSEMLSDYFHNIDGIEAFTPNIYTHQLYNKYTNLYNEDITKFNTSTHYDIMIFGDIIEHLSVEDAQKVLSWAREHADEIIVAVPYNLPQDAIYDNQYEIHKQSDLTRDIFTERYPGFKLLFEVENIYAYFVLEDAVIDYWKMYCRTITRLNTIVYDKDVHTTKDYIQGLRYVYNIEYSQCRRGVDNKSLANELKPYIDWLFAANCSDELPDFYRFWRLVLWVAKYTDNHILAKAAALRLVKLKRQPVDINFLDYSPEYNIDYDNLNTSYAEMLFDIQEYSGCRTIVNQLVQQNIDNIKLTELIKKLDEVEGENK